MPEGVKIEELLTPDQVCDVLKISRATFYRLVASGRLQAVKIGSAWRVKCNELRRLIEAQSERSRFRDAE